MNVTHVVHHDRAASVPGARDGDVDGSPPVGKKVPQGGGATVAEHRVRATCQHGRLPVPLPGNRLVADGVDALVEPVQATGPCAVLDGTSAKAKLPQLPVLDDGMLLLGKRSHCKI